MKVKIYPGFAKGQVKIPPSKSFLHRAIICASLAKGTSIIKNVIYSDDVKATIEAFKTIGVKIEKQENSLRVVGYGRLFFLGEEKIDCNESGTTLRFLTPLFANDKGIYLTGKSTLLSRPMSIYENVFKEKNLIFDKSEEGYFLKGELPSGTYEVDGNISSQFISGLLLTLPLKTSDSKIIIKGDFESAKYTELTIDVMSDFGVNITKTDYGYYVEGNQVYKPTNYKVEADCSQLAFFAVGGILNGDIKISNINLNSLQPDSQITNIIKKMNGRIIKEKSYLRFVKSQTNGINIDVSQCPDIAPILSVLGALSLGETKIENASRLKIKETDRLWAINNILQKFGVKTSVKADSYIVTGQNVLSGNEFNSYNDHRMVMSIAIASLRSDKPVIIEDYLVVNKSYPSFFEDLASLGIKIEYIEE
jgi:3-phosphoshikimate 1-carboxyvinyltransferase